MISTAVPTLELHRQQLDAWVEHGVLGKVIQFTYRAHSCANQEAAMQTISATDLARNTREVLVKVVTGQGAAWLEDSRQGFDDAVPNPWA